MMSAGKVTEISKWNSVQENWDFAFESGGVVDAKEATLIIEAAKGLGGVSFYESLQAEMITRIYQSRCESWRANIGHFEAGAQDERGSDYYKATTSYVQASDNYLQAANIFAALATHHSIFPGSAYRLFFAW